jgi:hypothetical protein
MEQAGRIVSTTLGVARNAAVLLFVLAVLVGGQLAVNAIEDASWDAGAARARYSLALLLVTVALAAVAERIHRSRPGAPGKLGLAGALLVCCACLPPIYSQQQLAALRFDSPHLNDIALTTMAAAKTIASGRNPYTSPVDPRAESREQRRNYDGFKYMPLMAVAYLPAAIADSQRTVIIINALLNVLTTVLVYFLARSLSGELAGGLAVIFYLSIRMVPRQLYGPGVTDLAAVVPLLAAFLAGETLPLLSGLLVGLSVSTKVLPALALVPVFAPAVNPWKDPGGRRFWLGFALGCLPSLFYLAWAPAGLLSNVVFFNLFRPVDSTSWLDGHPANWRTIATVALLCVLAAGASLRWILRPAASGRAVLVLVLVVSMTLLGPVNHGNYQLWWLPWFSAILGVSLAVYLHPRAAEPTAEGLA